MKAPLHSSLFGHFFGVMLAALLILPGTYAWAANCKDEDTDPIWIAMQRAEYNRAIKLATQVIKSGRLEGRCLAYAHTLRGISKKEVKQKKMAATDFTRSVALLDAAIRSGKLTGGHLATALHYRAQTQNELGRKAEAIADYTAAIQAQPSNTASYVNRGNIYRRLRRYELAFADYDSALRIKETESWAYRNRADTLRYLGRHEEAIADINKALALDVDGHIRWFDLSDRGDAYFLKGDYARAISDYEQSLALNPRNDQAKQKIARAREAMKRAARPGYTSDRDLWRGVGLERPSQKE